MMLGELGLILENLGPETTQPAYRSAIINENVLGKPTHSSRQRTASYLIQLYALDPRSTVYRLLRLFWSKEHAGRPMLAFLAACARDSLLRESTLLLRAIPPGEVVHADQIAEQIRERHPETYRPTTLKSSAQNLASSWTQAGYLRGKVTKRRSRPVVTPLVTSYALVLGHLLGLRGKLLLDSMWTQLLDRPMAEITDLVFEASKQGWLRYKAVGSVAEITFPGLLSPAEDRLCHGTD
jgi:hypothetical protein